MNSNAVVAAGLWLGLSSLSAQIPVLSSEIKSFMGDSEAHPLVVSQRPAEPHTSFHTQTGYLPEYDIRTDAVIVYDTEKAKYDSWKARGYDTQTMYCFRADKEYLDAHPGTGQTNAKGEVIKVGEGRCYYMDPTTQRIETAVAYFDKAIDNGSTAVVPEEPEYFAEAGYSQAFKDAWLEHYKEPWQDPASSLEARWKSETLKARMEFRMISAILESAKAKKSSVKRMVAIHSPLHYYSYNIIFPYHRMLTETPLQELIAQVWTGTARAPTFLDGIEAERVFEWGYLEYSSLYNFTRGTGKRLWFFMDPIEDNLDRGIEDYQENYEKTLIASLMFPEVDEYEVLPWPTRIYGKVPDWFATKMGAIINMLNQMHEQKGAEFHGGTQGIATFVADSMGWQRGEPFPSDMTGLHGLTLPLLTKGIPVQIAQLERITEPDYLNPYRVLLLSYDLLKPMQPSYNEALVAWVREGGTLLLFGGTDPYNQVDEWWVREGFSSPTDHLLTRLGLASQAVSSEKPTESRTLLAEPSANSPIPKIDLPEKYAITSRELNASPLYRLKGDGRGLIAEQKVGSGSVITVGISPNFFASSRPASDLMRFLVSRACQKSGLAYTESGFFGIRRGKYYAAQSLDHPIPLKGMFVDVVGRDFPVKRDPVIPPGGRCVYADISAEMKDSIPRILISSDRIEASVESPDLTSMYLTGPLKTKGLVRVSTGGRKVAQVTAIDSARRVLDITPTEEEGFLLLRYDSLPDGVILKIEWQKPAAGPA
jgi:hypothetical protein